MSKLVAGAKLLSAGKPLEFSPEDQKEVTRLRNLYPERASAVMPALWLAQKRWGFISVEAVRAVAKGLDLPESEVAQVATFYTMYHLAPVGRHVIQVCCTLSCSLMGAEALVEHLEKRLGIHVGETTSDGRVTLKKVECLASCGTAPMLQINEDQYRENLDLDAVDRLLAELK
jgi:NADH-quinone oxidoreductase subunit E